MNHTLSRGCTRLVVYGWVSYCTFLTRWYERHAHLPKDLQALIKQTGVQRDRSSGSAPGTKITDRLSWYYPPFTMPNTGRHVLDWIGKPISILSAQSFHSALVMPSRTCFHELRGYIPLRQKLGPISFAYLIFTLLNDSFHAVPSSEKFVTSIRHYKSWRRFFVTSHLIYIADSTTLSYCSQGT